MKFLREVVSRDRDFIEGLSMKKVVWIGKLMHPLSQLRGPQSELLLL